MISDVVDHVTGIIMPACLTACSQMVEARQFQAALHNTNCVRRKVSQQISPGR